MMPFLKPSLPNPPLNATSKLALWKSLAPNGSDNKDKDDNGNDATGFHRPILQPQSNANTQSRFYELDQHLAKLARFPVGCAVVARLPPVPTTRTDETATTMVIHDHVDTIHVDLVTSVVHYRLACQYHLPLIPEDALAFGRGTPVWMRSCSGGGRPVAAQILAATLYGGGTHFYSARLAPVQEYESHEHDCLSKSALTYHNVPNLDVCYRDTTTRMISPPSRSSFSATTTSLTMTTHSSLFNEQQKQQEEEEAYIPPNLLEHLDSLTSWAVSSPNANQEQLVPTVVEFSSKTESTTAASVTETSTASPAMSPVTVLTGETESSSSSSSSCGLVSVETTTAPDPASMDDQKPTTLSSDSGHGKSWATVACQLQSVARLEQAKPSSVPPDTTFGIPAWVVTPQLQGTFKKYFPFVLV